MLSDSRGDNPIQKSFAAVFAIEDSSLDAYESPRKSVCGVGVDATPEAIDHCKRLINLPRLWKTLARGIRSDDFKRGGTAMRNADSSVASAAMRSIMFSFCVVEDADRRRCEMTVGCLEGRFPSQPFPPPQRAATS